MQSLHRSIMYHHSDTSSRDTTIATPLSKTEEAATMHLIKRKLLATDSSQVTLRTGGTVRTYIFFF